MRIYDVIWKERFVDKIEDKHGLTMGEVESYYSRNLTLDWLGKDILRVRTCMQRTVKQMPAGMYSYCMFENEELLRCQLQLAT